MVTSARGLFILIISLATTLPFPANTHTHIDPDGATVTWYPNECCHDRDCQPVASVRQTAQGLWMTTIDGQTVLIGRDEERRPSRDARWHICLTKDVHDNVIVQCLFQPPST